MTDTIRPKIDAIAPALLGAGNRTLSDIYDILSAPDAVGALRHDELLTAISVQTDAIVAAISAMQGAGLSNTLSDIGVDVRAVKSGLTIELENIQAQLDKLQAAIGAEPYADLELGSVRGYLNNANSTLSTISQSIGATVPNEPYLAVRPYLSQIAQNTNATSVAAQAGNALLGDIDVRLGDVNVNLLSGNSLLGDIDIGISGDSGIISTILGTSGSIRLDLVAVQDAVAGGASATVAEIITQTTALGVQTSAQTTALGNWITDQTTALGVQTTAQTTALGVQTSAQTTALEGAINANGAALETTLTGVESVLLSQSTTLSGIQSNTFDALALLQALLDSTVEPPPP